jgi:hypothetical protein
MAHVVHDRPRVRTLLPRSSTFISNSNAVGDHELITLNANSFVQTDLGNHAANLLGLDAAEITVEESTTGIVSVIDESTKETHGGKFIRYSGDELAW